MLLTCLVLLFLISWRLAFGLELGWVLVGGAFFAEPFPIAGVSARH